MNCDDFPGHAEAQEFFIGTGGSRTRDKFGLDSDHDGDACETLD